MSPGYAGLTISCSLKTPLADDADYAIPEYVITVNIDGQPATLVGKSKEEQEAFQVPGPERGKGIRFLFVKNLQVRAGKHRLIVASPKDGIAFEKEIVLKDGSRNRLVLEPTYAGATPMFLRKKPADFTSGPSFRKGIQGFRVWLNGVD